MAHPPRPKRANGAGRIYIKHGNYYGRWTTSGSGRMMAAMSGLRPGELLGLRWRDLDIHARKVRVRQAYVRGEFKTP